MKRELIYIGSVNKAFKAKDVLKTNNIKSNIERVTTTQSKGCGYSILVVNAEKEIAEEILKNNGII